jgi:glycerate-2-kinase
VSARVRARLESIFRSALEAVEPGRVLAQAVTRDAQGTLAIAGDPLPRGARLVVLALGKAAPAMARALEAIAGDAIAGGLVVAKQAAATGGLPLRLGSHPVPDARSAAAGLEALRVAETAAPDDVLVVLLSGGASSLLATPAPGLAIDDLARANQVLLASGAAIDELNAVRKHLSPLSGGRLALRARSRRIEVLAISDVPGDRLDVIGSGPCAADPTRYADALAVLSGRGLRSQVPAAVVAHLEAGARGERDETPKPGDARLARVRHHVLASNATALRAAERAARDQGLRALVVTGSLAGEARVAGRRLAALLLAARGTQPVCLLAGGETTVHVRGAGRGGRCQELALAAAIELAGHEMGALLAAGTDGGDGPTDAAGAFADGGSVARGVTRGVDARVALADNDAYGFFEAEGGLLRTGPTGTNAMDLVLAWAGPSA